MSEENKQIESEDAEPGKDAVDDRQDTQTPDVTICRWTWNTRKNFWATKCGGGLDLQGGYDALKYSAIVYCPFCRKAMSDPFASKRDTSASASASLSESDISALAGDKK